MEINPPERDEVDVEHPAWRSLVGVGVGYFVLLAIIFGLLFVVPFLIFSFL
ncbi:MAG: hypothetical protein ABEK59_00215 [Halobacteria archaeon]